MRISNAQASFIKSEISKFLPLARVYLFGSRVFDDKKGGDIDILVIAERELTDIEKRKIKLEFFKQFGEQKIDIISYENSDNSNFKQIALAEGIEL